MMRKQRDAGHVITLDGAIDLHCHFGPEPFVEALFGSQRHSVSGAEAAQQAAAAGMSALVLKGHEFPTYGTAYAVQESVPDVQVFSGICLDHPVGCLNPHAAEVALRAGVKIVWLPTLSATASVPALREAGFRDPEGVRVLDGDGELLPEVREIMALVEEHDAILATGHIAKDEQLAVARAFRAPDRLIVTHAMQAAPDVTPLTADECVELADLGAVIELSAHSCLGDPAALGRVVDVIRKIGPERVALSTDYGFDITHPTPAQAYQDYVTRLWELGVEEDLLRTMTRATPEKLLGLR